MPIFDYMCKQCGHVSELLIRTNEEAHYQCPSCGSNKMEKLISSSYIIRSETSKSAGSTCCGKAERCATPPCSTGGSCQRD